jgi:hypothetical protein
VIEFEILNAYSKTKHKMQLEFTCHTLQTESLLRQNGILVLACSEVKVDYSIDFNIYELNPETLYCSHFAHFPNLG